MSTGENGDNTRPERARAPARIGARLRQLRLNSGLTLPGASAELRSRFAAVLSASSLSRVEQGKQRTSERNLEALCELYGISHTELRAQAADEGYILVRRDEVLNMRKQLSRIKIEYQRGQDSIERAIAFYDRLLDGR